MDLAKLLIDMSEIDKYGTYHVTNEDFCSWAEFAEYIFNSNNLHFTLHLHKKENKNITFV